MIYLKHTDLDIAGTQTVKHYHNWQHTKADIDYQHMCEQDHGTNSVWWLSRTKGAPLTHTYTKVYVGLGLLLGTLVTNVTWILWSTL